MADRRHAADPPERVLVVAPQPFLEDRGTPIAVHEVIRGLLEIGYAVDVLTYPMGRALQLPGVRVFRIPNPFRFRYVPVGLSARKLVLDALLVGKVRKLVDSGEYSCIHAVEEAAFPAAWFAARRSIPVVYDMQSSLPEQLAQHAFLRSAPAQRVLRRCERWLLRRADWVIGSSGLAEYVASVAPEAKVSEWSFVGGPPQASPDDVEALRRELGLDAGARVVLYTGTFEEYQGLPILAAAAVEVRKAVPAVKFLLVGAQGRHADRRPPRRIGASDTIRVVPRQPRERIGTYLALADVLVSPRTHGGNIPLKIFDYLAAGRPIVATDLPMHRAVLDRQRAMLVPPTPDAFAEAIIRLLQDPEHARRLAESGQAHARENLSWAGFVESLRAVYAAVCGPAPVPPGAAP